jgi:hypothetical protein
MPDAFLSYSRANDAAVAALADDIRELGYRPWFDRELSGGQEWWNQILERIRSCDVFVLALSSDSLESEACKREYTYAADMRRPILPVLVERGLSVNLLPPALSAIQFVDYTTSDRNAALRLARALSAVPPPGPLPDPLPRPPAVPVSYLGGLTERIQADELTFAEQSSLLMELRRALGDPDTRTDALTLAAKLRKRRDLFAVIADDLDELLGRRAATHTAPGRPTAAEAGQRPLGIAGAGTLGAHGGGARRSSGPDPRGASTDDGGGRTERRGEPATGDGSGLLDGPTERKAFLLQIFLGAGMFLIAPDSRRRWVYPVALLLGLWGLSLAPDGLDLDLGGQLDTELDGPASFFAVVGGLTYAAGIVDLLMSVARRKKE